MLTHIFLQARFNSQRLPGKILKKICGKTILELILERVQKVKLVDKIVLVTGDVKKNKILILFFVISSVSYSQKLTLKDYVIEQGDTILISEVPIVQILTFNDAKEKVRYNRLKRKVLKVYPYAIYTKKKLKEIEEELSEIKRRRKKKQHTKQVSSFLKEELGEKMKKLTRTEGNILVKLIYRETNMF